MNKLELPVKAKYVNQVKGVILLQHSYHQSYFLTTRVGVN